jgi:hypothetical protein
MQFTDCILDRVRYTYVFNLNGSPVEWEIDHQSVKFGGVRTMNERVIGSMWSYQTTIAPWFDGPTKC